jgi:hypothetical protein
MKGVTVHFDPVQRAKSLNYGSSEFKGRDIGWEVNGWGDL